MLALVFCQEKTKTRVSSLQRATEQVCIYLIMAQQLYGDARCIPSFANVIVAAAFSNRQLCAAMGRQVMQEMSMEHHFQAGSQIATRQAPLELQCNNDLPQALQMPEDTAPAGLALQHLSGSSARLPLHLTSTINFSTFSSRLAFSDSSGSAA
jgi:hypothetical protein